MPDSQTMMRARKIPIGAMLRGPGPAHYSLPSETGSSGLDCTKKYPPSYTMRPTLRTTNKERSPGPGTYSIKAGMMRSGSYNGSQYTMRIRPDALNKVSTPGPNAYKLTSTTKTKEKTAPGYTMRPKLGTKQINRSPGPNVYSLPTYTGVKVVHGSPKRFGTAASWSMTGRSEIGSFTQQTNKTPGPGKYRVEATINNVRNRQPTFTMRPRCYAPGSNMNTPGPKYNVKNVRASNKKIQGGTFGSKHSDYLYTAMD